MLRDSRGTAVLEMALVLPLFLMILLGIVSYADWFFIAHNVQQSANDAARAAVAGLTSTERLDIAVKSAKTNMRRVGSLEPEKATFSIDDDGMTFSLRVRYDASSDPLLHLAFVASPPLTIERAAAVKLDTL